jgi:hypothetical protein
MKPRPIAGGSQDPEAETTTTSNDFSRDKLRYVRPGDICRDICRNTPQRRASYNIKDSSDMMMSDIEEDQGELFPVDADDDAYDWDEVEDDGIAPQVVRDVKTPTAQEVDEHNCTHIPSQAWCPACVAGKKPNSPHKRKTEGEHLVPEIGLDYAFLRDSDSDETLTVLVMKDRDSKTIFADVVEMKGRGLEGTVENAVRNIARLGYTKGYPVLRPRTCDRIPHRGHDRSTKGAHDPTKLSSWGVPSKRTC